MITLRHISKKYRDGKTTFFALEDVSLHIERGEFVSILGPSGSGKSTLLHVVGGLDRPSSGTVEVGGKVLGEMGERELARFRNTTVGFVFQFFYLLPYVPTLDNAMLPLIYSKKRVNRNSRAMQVLRAVGLDGKIKNRPNELSGGEQQRVAIARALMNDPEIVLADEPTGNLDTKTGNQIIDILVSLNRRGKTLVVVTHDESIAARAHRMIRLRDGKIIS